MKGLASSFFLWKILSFTAKRFYNLLYEPVSDHLSSKFLGKQKQQLINL